MIHEIVEVQVNQELSPFCLQFWCTQGHTWSVEVLQGSKGLQKELEEISWCLSMEDVWWEKSLLYIRPQIQVDLCISVLIRRNRNLWVQSSIIWHVQRFGWTVYLMFKEVRRANFLLKIIIWIQQLIFLFGFLIFLFF